MAFVGNTQHNLAHMLMHSNLFDELPEKYYDSAFLDRIHFYIPGWEVELSAARCSRMATALWSITWQRS